MAAPPRELQPAGARATAIAATRKAVEAHAKAATAGKLKGAPGVHVAKLFQSALATMETAHSLAKASDPGIDSEEISGVSKQQLSAAEAEQLVERITRRKYAEMENVGQRRETP